MLFSKENNMEKSCDKNQKQKEHKILPYSSFNCPPPSFRNFPKNREGGN